MLVSATTCSDQKEILMTLKSFLINYLSPVYLLLRMGHLITAFVAYFAFGANDSGILMYFVPLLLIWNGLRPWGNGTNIKEINNRLDDLNNKYK
jgi:hypothetical protein